MCNLFVPLWRDSGLRWPLLSDSLLGTFIPRSSPAFCATSRGRSLRWLLRSPVPTLTAKQENYESFPHGNNTNCTLSLCIHRSLLSIFPAPWSWRALSSCWAHREKQILHHCPDVYGLWHKGKDSRVRLRHLCPIFWLILRLKSSK